MSKTIIPAKVDTHDTHYVVFLDIANECDGNDVSPFSVAHSKETALEYFRSQLPSIRKVAEGAGYAVYRDDDNCFEAGKEGEYCVEHIALYVKEVKENEE